MAPEAGFTAHFRCARGEESEIHGLPRRGLEP